ncbi:PIN-like domain-containing protein [Paenibacillus silvae]|uniref:PIN-like domain-containing protein n=1 Tax=Paenibacillus silvae TaxID=1325358 RepID=UPI0025A26DFF|nr:PIN-like domain-containing protein [Paenibacillus silvae]MDM5277093.1 PIN-like domain-containing protein [Paenibacillus silvae]
MTIEYAGNHSIDKHFFKPKSLEELKKTATVVVDTNVLLAAYQWKEVTLIEVKDTLSNLSNVHRLKIPSHVVKEFMDQRPKKIVEMNQKIERELLSKFQKMPNLTSIVPFIEMLPESKKYLDFEKEYFLTFNNYKKSIQEIISQIRRFINIDPVLDSLEQLILSCYYELDENEMSKIEEEVKERSKKKTPPLTGGDSGKKENYQGDYIIWKHILKIGSDVIFVTTDTKEDWVIKDHHGNVLSARRELIEEFFEVSEGRSFTIMSPKEFVELFKPEVDIDIVEDLESIPEIHSDLFYFVRDLFNKYDPAGVYSETLLEDEYDAEVDDIITNLTSKTNKIQIEKKIRLTIEKYFDKSTASNIPHDKLYIMSELIYMYLSNK